jgi:hypothetical protein
MKAYRHIGTADPFLNLGSDGVERSASCLDFFASGREVGTHGRRSWVGHVAEEKNIFCQSWDSEPESSSP